MTTTTELFAYQIAPMDFGWDLLPTVKEFYSKLVQSSADLPEEHVRPRLSEEIAEVEAFVLAALQLGRQIGWEGDFRPYGVPRIAVLPDAESPKLALVWKQDNNGTTFVVSQCELPWLSSV